MLDEESGRRTVLSLVEAMSGEAGKVKIDDFFLRLDEEYHIGRVTAGKLLVQLYKQGKIVSPEYHYIQKR